MIVKVRIDIYLRKVITVVTIYDKAHTKEPEKIYIKKTCRVHFPLADGWHIIGRFVHD